MFEPLFNFLNLFKNIPADDIDLISKNIRLRQVKESEILLKEGKLANELFFICKGILKIVTVNDKGKEVTQFFLKENQFCTILNSLKNRIPSHENIIAACNAELIVFTQDKLLYLYDQLPYFRELVDKITQQTLMDKIQIRNNYSGEDASTRYQKFLLRQPEIALRVSLSDVASYLGITQQSLSRIRKNVR